MGAEYLFYMKSIETHARAFLALIILAIGRVTSAKYATVGLDSAQKTQDIKRVFYAWYVEL